MHNLYGAPSTPAAASAASDRRQDLRRMHCGLPACVRCWIFHACFSSSESATAATLWQIPPYARSTGPLISTAQVHIMCVLYYFNISFLNVQFVHEMVDNGWVCSRCPSPRLCYLCSIWNHSRKTSPNSRKHSTSLYVSIPVLLDLAVHVLSSSSSTGSPLNTASSSK